MSTKLWTEEAVVYNLYGFCSIIPETGGTISNIKFLSGRGNILTVVNLPALGYNFSYCLLGLIVLNRGRYFEDYFLLWFFTIEKPHASV